MKSERKLIEISKTSRRGTSLRFTLTKKVAELLAVGEGEFIGFYLENGKVYIEKIS